MGSLGWVLLRIGKVQDLGCCAINRTDILSSRDFFFLLVTCSLLCMYVCMYVCLFVIGQSTCLVLTMRLSCTTTLTF